MGQAKLRGTYEDRKAAAIAKRQAMNELAKQKAQVINNMASSLSMDEMSNFIKIVRRPEQ